LEFVKMAKKIIFFTASGLPTSGELAAIAALNAYTLQPFEVIVQNGAANPNYGAGKNPADYVAGTVPTAYNAVPVFNPASPPASSLPSTNAIIKSGQELTIPVTGVYISKVTLTVVNGVVTAAVLS
jgi:hypothetical protein